MRTWSGAAHLLATALLAALMPTAGGAPLAKVASVSALDEGKHIRLSNEAVSLLIEKRSGRLAMFQVEDGPNLLRRGAGYLDANGIPLPRPAGRSRTYAPMNAASWCRICRDTPGLAEVAVQYAPSGRFPFEVELHYVLRRGDRGVYLYVVYRHDAGLPPAELAQTRYVLRGDPKRFTHHAVDDQRQSAMPPPGDLRPGHMVMDATYRLPDGSVYTKYDFAVYEAAQRVHGIVGSEWGLWVISASSEYLNGGPVKQNLTVHQTESTPVLLKMLQSAHYGSGAIRVQGGWQKLYGPFLVYANRAAERRRLWHDAKRQAVREVAAWPYPWMRHPLYVQERGQVAGTLTITDGTDPKGAWIILAAPGGDWAQQGRGYQFWTQADQRGRFVVPKVRPGRYTLYAIATGAFGPFSQDGVKVIAGRTTALGKLLWRPEKHGRQLWQLGVPDRTAREFRNGDDFRHWGLWLKFPEQFPEGVNFVIGQSRERRDWGHAHWIWAGRYANSPVWRIHFDTDQALAGKATLTIAIAGAHRARLAVALNDKPLGELDLTALRGGAGYRSGIQDIYRIERLTFDAARLKQGRNILAFRHARPVRIDHRGRPRDDPNAYVMYDSIRLEVRPDPAPGPDGDG
jgi:rhamnogalacturonan endolyase